MIQIPAQHRTFLEGIRQVAFSNPFASETHTLNRSLAGLSPSASMREVYTAQHQKLGKMVDNWLQGGTCRIQDVVPKDREMVTYVLLYRLLLDAQPELDQLTENSKQTGTEGTLPFPQGRIFFQRLRTMGYSRQEASKRLAILFQIRRAFYQLDRTLIGSSRSMEELRRRLWRNIFTADIRWYVQGLWERMEDFSLLLLGETGCGKGMAASAVGRSVYIPFDPDRMGFTAGIQDAFQEINLSEFAPGVLESELFGHRKGAFTGAIESTTGLLGQCPTYGSIFMDEVGDLSESIQVKLLRVLQERTFSPVGSRERHRFEGRVIAATNRPLKELLGSGHLREDLYYRMSSDRIEVPSLRKRIRESDRELPELAGYLLRRMTGWAPGELHHRVLNRLLESAPATYDWPGNVRELEQALRRILLTGHYTPPVSDPTSPTLPDAPRDIRTLPPAERESTLKRLYDQYGTYSDVARLTGLDRRTVKRWIGGQ